ncbi:MAG TPA: hypothetical protein VEN47_05160, partial [Myxococcota bacterium]|nr:hypothetical protein [Myxococcota bacterium]
YLEAHGDRYDRDFDPLPALLARLIMLQNLGVIDDKSVREADVRRVVSEARGVPVRIGRVWPIP